MKMSSHFARQQTADIMRRIDASESTSVVGVPGAGITIFLRHIANEIGEEAYYVDTATLPELSSLVFYNALLHSLSGKHADSGTIEDTIGHTKEHIQRRLNKGGRAVIVIAGFDHLQPEFSSQFFHYLQTLHAIDPKRVIFIFGSCRRLDTILPSDLIDINVRLFASTYYLQPYSENDCRYLLSKFGIQPQMSSDSISRLIKLSGGHFQLLQLLINSEYKSNPVEDTFIQLVFKNILSHLTAPQKNAIKRLAINTKYDRTDEYLANVGIIMKKDATYTLFSELFAEYIRAHHSLRLPIKERRLLAILKKHEGRIVTKNEIYDAVWRGNEIGSEWALNALIYRLRKHPAFRSQSYLIESHKKVGYLLTKT